MHRAEGAGVRRHTYASRTGKFARCARTCACANTHAHKTRDTCRARIPGARAASATKRFGEKVDKYARPGPPLYPVLYFYIFPVLFFLSFSLAPFSFYHNNLPPSPPHLFRFFFLPHFYPNCKELINPTMLFTNVGKSKLFIA